MLPIDQDVMPVGPEPGPAPMDAGAPGDAFLESDDPVATGLRNSVGGSHYLVLPPGVPAPTGMTAILPIPSGVDMEKVFAMMQAAEAAGEQGPPAAAPPSPMPPMTPPMGDV